MIPPALLQINHRDDDVLDEDCNILETLSTIELYQLVNLNSLRPPQASQTAVL